MGLSLIDSLSTQWGTDVDDARGKTVWFEIDTTGRAGSEPSVRRGGSARS
jgi:hypothetical protein